MDGTSSSRNRAIDALRLVVALIVVASHLRLMFFQDYADTQQGIIDKAFYLPSSLGTEAVLVFFALSGYWVGGSVIRQWTRKSFHIGKFALSRLIRLGIVLLPALVLTLLFDKIGQYFFGDSDVYSSPHLYDGIDPDPSHSFLTLLGNLGFVQEIHVNPYGYNHPLWSLAYEFWYYVIFAAAAIAFGLSQTWWARILAVSAVVVSCLIVGIPVLELSTPWLLGAGAAWAAPRVSRRINTFSRRSVAILRILTASILFISMLTAKLVKLRYLGTCMIGLSTASLLILLHVDVSVHGFKKRILNGVTNLADSSYSLYAIHMPILVLAVAAFGPNFSERWDLSVETVAYAGGIMVALIYASVLFAAYTEKRTAIIRHRLTTMLFSSHRAPSHDPAR